LERPEDILFRTENPLSDIVIANFDAHAEAERHVQEDEK